MDIFKLRNRLISDYEPYMRGFINVRDPRILEKVDEELKGGLLWPHPLIQLNPSFEMGEWIDELVSEGALHQECSHVFRVKSNPNDEGSPMRLYRHQAEAIKASLTGENYILTTGTGSGKSLSYIIPIVNHVLKQRSGKGIQAIIVYPMNALANSQSLELERFLCHGYSDGKGPVTFRRYTGQEKDQEKQEIIQNPPDILLTNYVMLELILTRPQEAKLINSAVDLRFLVLDELHTYRGRQGADVALLVRRIRERLKADKLQCVGTSATLATGGTYEDQRKEIAEVGKRIFGSLVKPSHVIGETLKRATEEANQDNPDFIKQLATRAADTAYVSATDYHEFIKDPLASWIESTFGIMKEQESGRLIRQKPRSITGNDGAANDLSKLTGLPADRCIVSIQECLLAGSNCKPSKESRLRPFAFRLHQFISRGDTVYSSLQSEPDRYITVHGQQFVPDNEEALLFPMAFCRECGQEYYIVRKGRDRTGNENFISREFDDRESDESTDSGYLFLGTDEPWPHEPHEMISLIPEDWLEEHRGNLRIKRDKQKYIPRHFKVSPDGHLSDDGVDVHFIPMPFQFCLRCGVTYGSRQRQDFSKLGSLGSEGRSTATTILSLSSILNLRKVISLQEKAKKLLSFTDNRQDASLQAGHFNDFIETSIIRAALFAAVSKVDQSGISHDDLPFKVFDALDLPFELYVPDPTIRFQAEREAKQTFRNVLAYRIYRDLKRGWRILSPNLEQCGLLRIEYLSLDEACQADDVWQLFHPALSQASPETRKKVAKAFLDYLRRELVIKVDYLDSEFQERIRTQSNQRLISPWSIDENEPMEHASIAYPRPSSRTDFGGDVYLSPRGRMGQYFRQGATFPHLEQRPTSQECQHIIEQLLEALRIAGIVEMVHQPRNDSEVPGYQIQAAAMRWVQGDGSEPYHDPFRVPRKSSKGASPNQFFINFYRSVALETKGLEAHEHTAQVVADIREKREEAFREGKLKVMFCSPTMELGVDISDLNIVNMRNVPPTPANYAQRSGRAGRSGQPALVFTYCSIGSPHDQYFFRRPGLMVSGAVQAPRIDLTNEDLVRSHIQAIWIAEASLDLGKSLKEILDTSGDIPSLALLESVRDKVRNERIRDAAKVRARMILAPIEKELLQSDWYHEKWLDQVLSSQIEQEFERCCGRWRSLYAAALKQAQTQDRIIRDPNRSSDDKMRARRLRAEAESQLKLLTESESAVQSDFYSYRYFASEGFLPGYNFPRLPLSAYIPGSLRRGGRDEYLSRPRFLAITEFGPRAHVYHEGSRYEVNRVILPIIGNEELTTRRSNLCPECGYLHILSENKGYDRCEHCNAELKDPLTRLFRLENVTVRRRDKITSDEEERFRLGYELLTGVRFAERGTGPSCRKAELKDADGTVALLTYGQAATLWRINLGWKRRAKKEELGFLLDLERGYWSKRPGDEDPEDPLSRRIDRVIPYVEDRRNCMLISLDGVSSIGILASLQAALKNAIQVYYQLEENELAAEPLPNADTRSQILFYEAAEGGAGVLRHLVSDPKAMAAVAETALDLCHFDPLTGEDRRRAPGAKEDCVSACYNCLLSYMNQPDHQHLDRRLIKDILLRMKGAVVKVSPSASCRMDHINNLKKLCDSQLEKKWLDLIDTGGYQLPTLAQMLIESAKARPDFLYNEPYQVAVYIDGPPHDYPERHARDLQQTKALEDLGFIVLRFHHSDDWEAILKSYPNIFGGN